MKSSDNSSADAGDEFSKARLLEPGRTKHDYAGRDVKFLDQEWKIAQEFREEFECGKYRGLPMAVILAECENYDEVLSAHDERELDLIMQQLSEAYLAVIRPDDLIVRSNRGLFAFLMFNVDQFAAAKSCQSLKESLRKFSFLRCHLSPSLKYGFAVSDYPLTKSTTIEDLIDSARNALKVVDKLGEGAVIRSSDLKPTWQKRKAEHFSPGDLWLKKLDRS